MNLRPLLFSLSLLALPTATTFAQTAPRQLNTQPTLPDSVVRQHQQQRQTALPAPPPNTTRYAVGLKNGQVYRAYDVIVKQPVFGRSYLLLDDGQRFDLDQVRYYEDETGFYVRTTLPKSKRETTLRRDRVGRISLYSITRTQYSNSPYGYSPYGGFGRFGGYGYGYPYGGYQTVKTEYFSKDNGPIEDLSLRNLSVATSDLPASRALLDQARSYQRITTLSYVAAAGVVAAGIFSTFNSNESGAARISPLVYAGLPLLIVPLVLQGKQQRNIKQAISLYNRAQ
ncbi:hypothetical protein [Hymenobacter jejuensis]|uniref:Uncharacterized protein n=1 Tax=Hymenobacter jejuensis TaxID=2502781 RepID=A0A5B7ZX16_9BACT|nr:hypothetical protein [Hymenobacter jejuensis]QDA59417.1 hypothetical protein FHG12_04550 [Hymenobacter jejuensis]